MTIIELNDISFNYKNEIVLENINLKETEPVIAGIWGRNGSGKTTLMKLLSGQETQANGQISILNQKPFGNKDVSQNITYIRENHFFGKTWKVYDALKFASIFNDNWNQLEAERLLDIFDLPKNKKIKNFSKGMQSMLQSVIGLASNSPITMLDEPTNGLDAYTRKVFLKELKKSFENNPRYILIASHHIQEVERICEKLIVISNKSILFNHPIDYIQSRGVILVGNLNQIKQVVSDEEIIETDTILDQYKIMADIEYTDELKQICDKKEIKIVKSSIQDYLVNITKLQEVNYV